MRYEDLNPIDETKKAQLKAKAKQYITNMLLVLERDDPKTKAELLAEWYEALIVMPTGSRHIHHELFNIKNPEIVALLSLLILEIEVHKIAKEIAEELGIEFTKELKLSEDRSVTEQGVHDGLAYTV